MILIETRFIPLSIVFTIVIGENRDEIGLNISIPGVLGSQVGVVIITIPCCLQMIIIKVQQYLKLLQLILNSVQDLRIGSHRSDCTSWPLFYRGLMILIETRFIPLSIVFTIVIGENRDEIGLNISIPGVLGSQVGVVIITILCCFTNDNDQSTTIPQIHPPSPPPILL